ncbi:MAG: hypothetical protein O7G85_07455 [Planctomycetota bacterium]|nr:hypothetical protein [Planctomycetota bacterium]
MDTVGLTIGSGGGIWPIVALITLWLVVMCLKTIGHGYSTSVRWHNLKVQAHRLRRQQKHDLGELQQGSARHEANQRGIDVEQLEPDEVSGSVESVPPVQDRAQAA